MAISRSAAQPVVSKADRGLQRPPAVEAWLDPGNKSTWREKGAQRRHKKRATCRKCCKTYNAPMSLASMHHLSHTQHLARAACRLHTLTDVAELRAATFVVGCAGAVGSVFDCLAPTGTTEQRREGTREKRSTWTTSGRVTGGRTPFKSVYEFRLEHFGSLKRSIA